jgi:hypothetical protein
MISTNKLATIVTVTGLVAWAGSAATQSWDLLTAWLVWGTVVLFALICELRRRPVQRTLPDSRHAANGGGHFDLKADTDQS